MSGRFGEVTVMRVLATLCAGCLGVGIAGCSSSKLGESRFRQCGITPDARAAIDCERERREALDAYNRETERNRKPGDRVTK
jgi:triphosphoribosyl-dephospho-CoA synthetase